MIDDELHELNERRLAELRDRLREARKLAENQSADLERCHRQAQAYYHRCISLGRELKLLKAERDAALKLVDDTLEALDAAVDKEAWRASK